MPPGTYGIIRLSWTYDIGTWGPPWPCPHRADPPPQLRVLLILLIHQLCLVLQIVVVGPCTLIDIGVVPWFGKFSGGHMQWRVGLLLPLRHG